MSNEPHLVDIHTKKTDTDVQRYELTFEQDGDNLVVETWNASDTTGTTLVAGSLGPEADAKAQDRAETFAEYAGTFGWYETLAGEVVDLAKEVLDEDDTMETRKEANFVAIDRISEERYEHGDVPDDISKNDVFYALKQVLSTHL